MQLPTIQCDSEVLNIGCQDKVNIFTPTHSDIGLQLTQFPGKMAMEPKGERVGALEGVLTKELFT